MAEKTSKNIAEIEQDSISMEFSTKSYPTPPEKEGAGIVAGEAYQLYDKKIQNDLIILQEIYRKQFFAPKLRNSDV